MNDSVKRVKRQMADWEEILPNHISEKKPYI